VRWRQAGRNRSKVLGRKRDAEAFDAEIVRRKRTGELARLDAGKEPLAEFGEEWWRLHAEPNLARSTLKGYASIWDAHVLPRLGSVPLRELTPDVVNRFRLELEAEGVGPASIRKSLVLLQGVLQRACEWGRLASNPAAIVRKPVPPRKRTIVPLAPERVEAIRFVLLACGRIRDATLVSVLAYAGLRPGEALALRWTHVRERTLLIEGAVSLGAIEGTKIGRTRTVRVLGPLAQDLADWRLHAGRPPAEALLFPGYDGEPWTATAYRNWRRRIYTPAAEAAGVERPRPYDLRHSFVSLLIAEGRNVVDVARQAGHSPTVALDT
jgi:integrase